MFGHLDPNEWVQAWNSFKAGTPYAAIATVVALWLVLVAGVIQLIAVPLIRALKGKGA